MAFVFLVDGEDFSSAVNRYSFTVGYEIREGTNSGTTLDGANVTDVLARKVVITATTNPLDSTKAAELISALNQNYVSVTYSSPTSLDGEADSGYFLPEVTGFKAAIYRESAILWEDGANITLTEV